LAADIIASYKENTNKAGFNKMSIKPYHIMFGSKVASDRLSNQQSDQALGLDITADKV
jgi:hypothetical protein